MRIAAAGAVHIGAYAHFLLGGSAHRPCPRTCTSEAITEAVASFMVQKNRLSRSEPKGASMHTRVPITLRIVHPQALPVPTVASVDVFAVLQL
jgi:hypothetical protein